MTDHVERYGNAPAIKSDGEIVAGFLDLHLDEFAEYLEDVHEIDGSTEAGVIIERINTKNRTPAFAKRACPRCGSTNLEYDGICRDC